MDRVIISPQLAPIAQTQVIDLRKAMMMEVQRRKRRAKRLFKRWPMLAVQFMQEQYGYKDYTHEKLMLDIKKNPRKGKRYRKAKSPLKRQGRYEEYALQMRLYENAKKDGDIELAMKYLQTAQTLRNRMYLGYEVQYQLKGDVFIFYCPSIFPLKEAIELSKYKFNSWEELASLLEKRFEYAPQAYFNREVMFKQIEVNSKTLAEERAARTK